MRNKLGAKRRTPEFFKQWNDFRFWNNVVKTDGCWWWIGRKQQKGYGLFWLAEGKNISAHRYLVKDKIPAGALACHTCDNPACVNPAHIFFGTNQDNMDDMMKKGRNNNPQGEDHPQAILSSEDVISIRSEYGSNQCTQRSLARKYGCSKPAIGAVISGRTWRHLLPSTHKNYRAATRRAK